MRVGNGWNWLKIVSSSTIGISSVEPEDFVTRMLVSW
jgi:hypothetical protein